MENTTQGKRRYKRKGSLSIPPQIEALLILLTDARKTGGDIPLTAEEVCEHPVTKDLGAIEQRLLVKHWPDWYEHYRKAEEYKERVGSTIKLLNNTNRRAGAIAREQDFKNISLPERLQITSEMVGEKVVDEFLFLSQMKPDELVVDEHAREVYKFKISYVKDMLSISKQMSELSTRQAAAEVSRVVDAQEDAIDEATERLLQQARAKLIEASVDAEVIDASA